jgi:hypothetical protein
MVVVGVVLFTDVVYACMCRDTGGDEGWLGEKLKFFHPLNEE